MTRVKEYQALKTQLESPTTQTPEELEVLQQEFAKAEKKLAVTVKKQEKVLFVTLHILLNLAEDLQIERKMKTRRLPQLLMILIERNNPDLLFIVLTFLKKLSVFGENKNEMHELGIIEKLNRFVPCNNALLTQMGLRLLFNLTFDVEIRDKVSSVGMIPKLVDLLKTAQYRSILLRILYHMSLEDKAKATFTYTSCIPLVYQLILHFPDAIIGKELIALAINLTINGSNAALMSQDGQLEELVKRAFKYNDVLLFRVIRNVSQFGPNTNLDVYEEHLENIINLA